MDVGLFQKICFYLFVVVALGLLECPSLSFTYANGIQMCRLCSFRTNQRVRWKIIHLFVVIVVYFFLCSLPGTCSTLYIVVSIIHLSDSFNLSLSLSYLAQIPLGRSVSPFLLLLPRLSFLCQRSSSTSPVAFSSFYFSHFCLVCLPLAAFLPYPFTTVILI